MTRSFLLLKRTDATVYTWNELFHGLISPFIFRYFIITDFWYPRNYQKGVSIHNVHRSYNQRKH